MLATAITLPTAHAAYTVDNDSNGDYITAQNIDAFFSFVPNAVIEINAASQLGIPNASVYGFSGDGSYDYYSFSVGTGASPLQTNQAVVFDTDFAEINGLDTILTLFDTDGTSYLADNDDAAFNGPGDLVVDTFNSFLSYSFDTAGTYFIRVGEWNTGTLDTDATYQLHVSSVPIPAAGWLFGTGLLGMVAASRRKRKAHAVDIG